MFEQDEDDFSVTNSILGPMHISEDEEEEIVFEPTPVRRRRRRWFRRKPRESMGAHVRQANYGSSVGLVEFIASSPLALFVLFLVLVALFSGEWRLLRVLSPIAVYQVHQVSLKWIQLVLKSKELKETWQALSRMFYVAAVQGKRTLFEKGRKRRFAANGVGLVLKSAGTSFDAVWYIVRHFTKGINEGMIQAIDNQLK